MTPIAKRRIECRIEGLTHELARALSQLPCRYRDLPEEKRFRLRAMRAQIVALELMLDGKMNYDEQMGLAIAQEEYASAEGLKMANDLISHVKTYTLTGKQEGE